MSCLLLFRGSEVYKKLCETVLNARLLKDIEQLSSDAQISCLESLHSLMIRFAPKSVAYSPASMSARWSLVCIYTLKTARAVIALVHFAEPCLHHNVNTTRQQACGSDGTLHSDGSCWSLKRGMKSSAQSKKTQLMASFFIKMSNALVV